MTKEEYLSQVGILTRRCMYRQEQILRMRRDADAVSCRWGEYSRSGGADAPYVRMIERIAEMEEKAEEENRLLQDLRAQAEAAIDRLPDENLKLVLLYRYLEGKNFTQIAEILYVCRLTVMRWKAKALELFTFPENPIRIFAEY